MEGEISGISARNTNNSSKITTLESQLALSMIYWKNMPIRSGMRAQVASLTSPPPCFFRSQIVSFPAAWIQSSILSSAVQLACNIPLKFSCVESSQFLSSAEQPGQPGPAMTGHGQRWRAIVILLRPTPDHAGFNRPWSAMVSCGQRHPDQT